MNQGMPHMKHWLARSIILWLMAAPWCLHAHQLDELVQLSRISVYPDNIMIQVMITPGSLIAADFYDNIDTNRDGAVSESECRSWADKWASNTRVDLDRKTAILDQGTCEFPDLNTVMSGDAIIRLNFSIRQRSGAGSHTLRMTNNNDPTRSIYLVNAAMLTTQDIRIMRQERDSSQRNYSLQYEVRGPKSAHATRFGWLLVALLVLMAVLYHPAVRRLDKRSPADNRDCGS